MKRTPEIANRAATATSANIVPPTSRAAAGKALREKVPRELQGGWKEAKGRANPIDFLRKSDAGRLSELVPIRYGRMLQSPFAFYRGAAGVMAADLARTPSTGLKVQACGDCHLMNFGGFATPERNVVFDINDFDETSPAPWEWDVKRLAASIMLAGRSIGLSDSRARDCAMSSAGSYRKHMREFAKIDPLRVWYTNISAEDFIGMVPKASQKGVRKRVEKAAAGSGSELDFPKLAGTVGGQIRITDQPPLIFHPESTRGPEAQATLERIFRAYRETLPDDRRMLFDRYRLVDVAIKVVGVGSVGRRCWIALLMSEANDPLFLQIKEAVASVRREKRIRPSWPARGNGTATDAAGVGYFPGLDDGTRRPTILCAPVARCQDQAPGRDIQRRIAQCLRHGLRLGARPRARESERRIPNHQRLSGFVERRVRPGDGKIRVGLRGSSRARSCRPQVCGEERQGHGLSRVLALQLPFPKVSESMGNHDSKIVDAGGVD
jgi:hypothetical protein